MRVLSLEYTREKRRCAYAEQESGKEKNGRRDERAKGRRGYAERRDTGTLLEI